MRRIPFLNVNFRRPLVRIVSTPVGSRPAWQRYGFAALVVALALLISLAFRRVFEPSPSLLFYGAIALAASFGGLGPALLASGLSLLGVHQFFLLPGEFWRYEMTDVIRLGVFVLVAFVVSNLHHRDLLNQREHEAFQVTLSSIGDAVIATDTQGQVVFLNEIAEQLTGWDEAAAVGKPVSEIFHIVNEDSGAPVENPIHRVLKEKRIVGLANHTVLIARDGTRRPISDSGSPIQNQRGQTLGAVLVFRDVTAERRAELALRESEARFRLMADTAPVMIWLSGPDKLCTYFNQPWLDFTGRTMEQEMGNGWTENIHPDDRDYCLSTYENAFDQRETFSIIYRLRRHDGVYRWVLNNGRPRIGSGGDFSGYSSSTVDITERKLADDRLAMLHELTVALSGAATPEEVADVIVTNALAAVGGSIGLVVLLDAVQNEVYILRTRGAPEEINQSFERMSLQDRLPVTDAIRQTEPVWIESSEEYQRRYPDITSILMQTGAQAAAAIPLIVNDLAIGAMGISFSEQKALTTEDREFLNALAQVCAQALNRAQLSNHAVELAANEERQRLARDLHDSISQTLFTVSTIAQTLPRLWERKPETIEGHLNTLSTLSRSAHAEMRVLLMELRPEQRLKMSLADQVRQLAEALPGRKSVGVTLTIELQADSSPPPPVQEAFYRITQEALNNVVKHSEAGHVTIELRGNGEQVTLVVRDDGEGFDTGAETSGIGMSSMREQAGADLRVTSQPGSGTEITLVWKAADTSPPAPLH